ncbi:MAG TPA: hypothetical protein VFJ70_06570 [Burkholderiales bacterium]|nr:hypothetical protein [Burkholderiales bacterium]
MRRMLSMVQHAWRRLEQAVAASRRREARRLVEHIEDRRRELVRRAAGRIGIY